jgi:hypothetical protein
LQKENHTELHNPQHSVHKLPIIPCKKNTPEHATALNDIHLLCNNVWTAKFSLILHKYCIEN